jgi:hypothetical protein
MDNQSSSGSSSLPSIGSQLPSLNTNVSQPTPSSAVSSSTTVVSAAKAPELNDQSVNAPTADVSNTTHMAVPSTADDSDLIEKEWIHKIEQIVEHTKDDPYEQSKELTVLKSEYLRRRYNKTIKIEE